jgi:CRISPR/Cas system-associated exonuclease Cas4 (RecB family)
MAGAGPTEPALSFENNIPSKFSGWHYSTWTLADLRQVARAINLIFRDGVQKRDLYQLIVEHRPESSQLSLAEANAIHAIKDARSLSKASTSRNQSNVPSIHTTVASKKRRSSARYRVTPRKRRSMHDFVNISSDSEYVDSDDDTPVALP